VSKRRCPQCGAPKDFYAKVCRSCYVPQKPLLGVKGVDHPSWKQGYRIDGDGYIRTYAPDHPWPRRGGYVPEHVRVMELSLGRRIQPGEVVHHIDHNKQNNDLENLQLLTSSQHSSLHRREEGERARCSGCGTFLDASGKCRSALHSRPRAGEENPAAKLTATQVREIRGLYATGEYTQKQLAEMMGVTFKNISAIVLRKTWKGVVQ